MKTTPTIAHQPQTMAAQCPHVGDNLTMSTYGVQCPPHKDTSKNHDFITRFEVGFTYCNLSYFQDGEQIKIFAKVLSRTDKTIKISLGGKPITKRPHVYKNVEYIKLGNYSQRPTVNAKDWSYKTC